MHSCYYARDIIGEYLFPCSQVTSTIIVYVNTTQRSSEIDLVPCICELFSDNSCLYNIKLYMEVAHN